MAKSMRTPLLIRGFGYFSHTHCWQVYKIKHTTMQSPLTNIGRRMGHTEELNDFQRGTVIRCHLSNKSVCQISALLELPQSTVSAVIVKRKCLGVTTTTAQLRSGRPHKFTVWDRRVLKHVAWEKSSVVGCNTHYRVPNGLWKQRQHKHSLSRASWNRFPWPSSRTWA